MNLDRVADVGAAGAAVIPPVTIISQVNEYLQAASFIVAIISGVCAGWYYWKKSRKVRSE